jgi:iron-sulfur cluster assembly accessory protein
LEKESDYVISVTETAATELQRLMTANDLTDAKLRIFVQSECGCGKVNFGMGFDEEVDENDQVIDSAGVGVVMDQQAFAALDGASVEFVDEGARQGFRISGVETAG